MIRYIVSILLIATIFSVSAQEDTIKRHCGNDVFLQNLSEKNPAAYEQMLRTEKLIQQKIAHQQSLRTTATYPVITIPVVVHVIHTNSNNALGGSNISDAQVFSQIDVLNKDYRRQNTDASNTPAAYQGFAADIEVQFCMANTDPNGNTTNGITRHYNATTTFNTSTVFSQVSTIVSWPSDQYLNIWVVNAMSGGVLGYAMFPGSSSAKEDGLIVERQSFGTVGTLRTKFNLGRTTTHEVGHWLGLYHTWGDMTDCSGTDYCDDTPVCSDQYEASSPACNAPIQCGNRRMIEDYMDYSQDACMNLFTSDQKDRMRSILTTDPRRIAIQSSLACCILPTLVDAPYAKDMEDGDITSGNWTLTNPTSGIYTKGFELAPTSAYGQGSYAAFVHNDSIYKASDPVAVKYHYTYTSPFFNIKSIRSPVLRFDWAYSPATVNGATDSIVVYYTSDCYGNWTALQTLYGTDFKSTDNPRINFIPAAQEWRTTSINLTTFQSQTGIRLKFVAYSKGINTFYLDNINIAETSGDLLVNVFPNPTMDDIQIETIFEGKQTVQYIIYNVLGQSVYTSEEGNVYSMTKTINLSSFTNGLYFIQVSAGGQKKVKRVIKI